VVSLTLAHRLKYGSVPTINDRQKITEIARELMAESPLSLDTPPSLDRIVEAYGSSVWDRDPAAIRESVLISAFVSNEFLDMQLEFIARESAKWTKLPGVFDTIHAWRVGRESWLANLAIQARDIGGLELKVQRNAELLGVEHIRQVPAGGSGSNPI
jgi:hypothetical protein